jgi:rubrerythrin
MNAVPAVASAGELLARAHAMEVEAAERYEEFAAQMELHSNLEVAALFRRLAGFERKHAAAMEADLAQRGLQPARTALAVPGEEGLETDLGSTLHYLMTPYHALEIALANEERAIAFFTALAETASSDEIRLLARGFAEEERHHAELVRDSLTGLARPREDWAYDPDEPHLPD